jgi:hypothetical protein
VNHVVDIRSWGYGASFGASGAFDGPLIPFGSHSFPFGRHPLPFESLFGFPLRLVFEQHFQHQPVLSRHV